MAYTVVGATYQAQSLAVFYAGLDTQPLLSYEEAGKEALKLLNAELAASTLPDLHELSEQVLPSNNPSTCTAWMMPPAKH